MRLPVIAISQHLGAWPEALAESIIANQGTFIAFRLGPTDARKLAPVLRPFTAEQLEELNKFEAVARLHIQGHLHPAFPLRTMPPPPQDAELLAVLRARSRSLYTRPRSEVEAELHEYQVRSTHTAADQEATRQSSPSTALAGWQDIEEE